MSEEQIEPDPFSAIPGVSEILAAPTPQDALRALLEQEIGDAREGLADAIGQLRAHYGSALSIPSSGASKEVAAVKTLHGVLVALAQAGIGVTPDVVRSVALQFKAVREGLRVRAAQQVLGKTEDRLFRISALVVRAASFL